MLPADPTLPELRAALAPALAANAAFDGWTPAARDAAADAEGIDRDLAALALSNPVAMIDAWFESLDAAMAELVPADALATMKVRDKIVRQVEARIDLLAPHRESLRRALAILAMPANLSAAARLGWRTADLLWRRAGDTATDLNHYTKRASLLAIYGATITVLLDDDSEGQATTRAFLARRIANLLAFEKAKGQFLRRDRPRPSLTRFIGRLRYPAT